MGAEADLDTQVRLHIYRTFAEQGSPPTPAEAASALNMEPDEAAAAYRELAEAHVIVLEPGSDEVWMAAPFSARPTPFRVEAADGRSWFGICVWDAPGILAMLGSAGTVATSCPDCDEPLRLSVDDGDLKGAEGAVAHFLVPAKKWWEDIGFT